MIYTIGHSTPPIDRFIALLWRHSVDALADVRSVPYSRLNYRALAGTPSFRSGIGGLLDGSY